MRLDDGRVVPNFVGQALRGESLTVYGNGSQTRSFCYCADTVVGLYRLLNSDYSDPVNLGNPTEMSIQHFAELINRLVGSGAGIINHPLPVDDPRVRRPDITRAREVLGWSPSVELEEGMRQTIEWFRGSLTGK
jgi:dTDP-glucose 4,6-dehydratase